MNTAAIDKLKAKRKSLRAVIDLIDKKIDHLLGFTEVKCKKCGSISPINKMTYIQTHWYVYPYSCTGGDRWHSGDGETECLGCGHRIRLYTTPEIMELKRLFRTTVDEYERK